MKELHDKAQGMLERETKIIHKEIMEFILDHLPNSQPYYRDTICEHIIATPNQYNVGPGLEERIKNYKINSRQLLVLMELTQ